MSIDSPHTAPWSTVRQILQSALLQQKLHSGFSHLVPEVVQPAAFLLVTLLSVRGSTSINAGTTAISAGLLSLWGSTIWHAGMILRFERSQGTLEMILVRPSNFAAVLLGKSLGATVRSAVLISATVGIVALLAGHPVVIAHPGAFVLAVCALLISATALGMLLSCVFVLTRAAARIAEALIYPVFILGGLLVPLRLLPAPVRPLAELISLHRGGDLARAAAEGVPQSGGSWLVFAATTCAYIVLTALLFRHVLRRAKEAGSLDLA